jgi:hypothetical protein
MILLALLMRDDETCLANETRGQIFLALKSNTGEISPSSDIHHFAIISFLELIASWEH